MKAQTGQRPRDRGFHDGARRARRRGRGNHRIVAHRRIRVDTLVAYLVAQNPVKR